MNRGTDFLYYGLPIAALGILAAAGISMYRGQLQTLGHVPEVQAPSRAAYSAPNMSPGAGGGSSRTDPIQAVGLLIPQGDEINISTQAPGIIDQVMVSPGQLVKAGDVLFVLDRRTANATVEFRRADLMAAERRRDEAAAKADSIRAQIEAARANAAVARADFDEWIEHVRASEALLAKGGSHTISPRELARRRNTQRTAEGRWQEAQARIAQLEAELKLIDRSNGPTFASDQAAVELARRMLERAEIDLALLTVRAPIDATVLQVNQRPGEHVSAGATVSPPVVLGNLERLQVRVDIDEANVGRFNPSAPAFASLRGQTPERMQLEFVRVEPVIVDRKALQSMTGDRGDARVLRVVYMLPNAMPQAYVGQLVDAHIESMPAQTADAAAPSEPFPWP